MVVGPWPRRRSNGSPRSGVGGSPQLLRSPNQDERDAAPARQTSRANLQGFRPLESPFQQHRLLGTYRGRAVKLEERPEQHARNKISSRIRLHHKITSQGRLGKSGQNGTKYQSHKRTSHGPNGHGEGQLPYA